MAAEPTNPVEVFYSYAHEDELLRDELKKQLAGLKRQGLISEWYDRDISPGNEWNEEIQKHLNSASVILLLISPDFIDSDYCNDIEVKHAMERHGEGTARVIPVILRATNWKGLPFSKLQALPTDGRAVTSWPNQDEAFLDIATGIETAIKQLSSNSEFDSNIASSSHLAPLAYIEPESAVGFVARKDRDGNDIIERLRAELAPRSNRVVALWGAGGVGKTAMAAKAIRSLIDDYHKRIAWISADGRDEFALPNLLDEMSNQLGRPELRTLGLEAKKQSVHELVTEAASLIVLDNFETVNPKEQSSCLEWLTHLSPSSVLITTRAKIEHPAIRNIPINPMLAAEANEFLDRLVQQAQRRHTFEHIDKDRLIQTAEANPLILQWVFAQIDLAQDWREVLDELAQGEGDAAHRVFDRSFNLPLLNNGGRAALLALSLFVPSASRSALAEVAGLSGDRNKKKFKESIRHLAALWLVRTTEDGTRLIVEGLTRDLAKARLTSDHRSGSIRERFVGRLSDFARRNSGETASDFNALEVERENLLAAIDIALSTKNWESAFYIYFNIALFLGIRGHWHDRLSRGNKLRATAIEANNMYALGSVAEILANTCGAFGEHAEAEQLFDESLEAFRTLQSEMSIANTLYNRGRLEFSKGEIHNARRLYNESQEIYERLGDESRLATIISALGALEHQQGNVAEARRLYRQSLDIKKKEGKLRGTAVSLHNLGLLEEEQGNVDQARQLYLKSLEIDKKLGDQRGIADSLNILGSLARQQGQLADALKLLTESVEIQRRLGNPSGEARTLHELGLIARDQKNLKEARQLFEQSLAIEKRLSNQFGVATMLHELGKLDLTECRLDNAEILLTQSFNVFESLNAKPYIAKCLEARGRLKLAQGFPTEARDLYGQGSNLAESLGQKSQLASIKHSAGLLAEKEKDFSLATKLWREALELYESLGFAKAETVKADLERVKFDNNRYDLT